jgi:hypothetical protein
MTSHFHVTLAHPTRRLTLIAGIAFVATVLSACAGFGPRTVDVPMEKLQASLAKQFPYNSDFARLLDLTVTSPKLRALPDENRLATEVALSIAPRFMNNTKLAGALTIDSALRFEASDQTVRLSNPRVRKLDIAGLKSEESKAINMTKLGEFLLENAMQDMIVYQVKEEDRKRFGANIASGDFKVTNEGLSITLTPQK